MYTEKEIEKRVRQQIESEEKLGEQAGGSGHLSYVSYRIDQITTKKLTGGKLEITYKYTLIVESEFTYLPDNPPYEYPYTKTMVIDNLY
jgi:hypothetical protein